MSVLSNIETPPSRHSRHSRFVAWMRRLLPVVTLALLAVLFAWPQIRANSERVQIGYGTEDLKTLGRNALTLFNARYYGLDKDLKPFSVLAETARQNEAEVITLEQPRADMQARDGGAVLLDARRGIYRQQDQTLRLHGDVSLYHDQGYEIHTETAMVDLAGGVAHGDDPVTGHGPQLQLAGEGFQMSDRGRTIHLTGKSHLVLHPGKPVP